jgi:hypothetical protein
MAVVLVLIGLFAVLGIAAALGWTPDTRDPEYSLGRVTRPHARPTVPDRPVRDAPERAP